MPYTIDSIDKIGNTIIYLANEMAPLCKTKLLKLLYLLDEFSIKKYHTPYFNLKYEVWQAGPVAKDIYIELSDSTPDILKDYIKTEQLNSNGINITNVYAKRKFSDDEFSDNDIALLEEIVRDFKNKTAKELVDLTHRPGSLWYNTVEKANLLELFDKGKINSSDEEIDFGQMLNDKEREFYKEQLELHEFTSHFKY